MPKQSIAAIALFVAVFFGAGMEADAGDSANFVDLGFSADGKVYMFAQYGVAADSLKPWAEIYAVDVPRNNFVPNGVRKSMSATAAEAGQDGSGLFHRLLADSAALAKRHGVDHTRQGTPLYVAIENGGGKAGEPVEFRDFDAGVSYKAVVNSLVEGSGASLRSSFFIAVDRTDKEGKTKKLTVGTPALKRPLIASYAIRRVISAPRNGSLVFVVEMRRLGPKGVDIRYMVEALRLR